MLIPIIIEEKNNSSRSGSESVEESTSEIKHYIGSGPPAFKSPMFFTCFKTLNKNIGLKMFGEFVFVLLLNI